MRGFGRITGRATIAAALVCSAFFLGSSGFMALASTGDGPARCEQPPAGGAPFWQPFCRSGGIPQRAPEQPPERTDLPALDERMAVEGLCKPPKGYTSDLFCRVDEARATVPPGHTLGDLP
jgi:hypothetical protein